MAESLLEETMQTSNLLLMELDDEVYGIDVLAVREVIGYRPYSAMPVGGRGVVGVLALRGAVIPVVDLRARLGKESKSPDSLDVYVIVENDGKRVALLVDAVLDVVPVNGNESQFTISGADTPVTSIVHLDGRSVAVLNPALLSED